MLARFDKVAPIWEWSKSIEILVNVSSPLMVDAKFTMENKV